MGVWAHSAVGRAALAPEVASSRSPPSSKTGIQFSPLLRPSNCENESWGAAERIATGLEDLKMALEIDSSRPYRSYADLSALSRAVLDCDDQGAEHHAIEWKSSLDLNTAAGAFAVSRAIVAFANRTVANSKRHFGGLAYLLVGVEPSKLTGVEQWDGEKLEPKLAVYLGADGPSWHHDNVTIDGHNVIVFTVEAPNYGDHIHTVRKTFSPDDQKAAAREGEIFVRRNSMSERPNTSELRALEARLVRGISAPEIEAVAAIATVDPPVVFPLDLSQPAIDAWIDAEADIVRAIPTKGAAVGFGALLGSPMSSDRRTASEYNDEVNKYLDRLRTNLKTMAVARAFSIVKDRLCVIKVTNPGDQAIEDLTIHVVLPTSVEPIFKAPDVDWPNRPIRFGEQTFADRFALAGVRPRIPSVASYWSPAIEHEDGRARFSFKPRSLHARQTVTYDEFALIGVGPVDLGLVPIIQVEITAKDRRGVARFELSALLASKVYPPLDLMRPASW